MNRDLQVKKDATTIMAKVRKASDLFLPMDSSTTSLEEIVPSFSACFEFRNPNSPPTNLVLEWSSSPVTPTIYERFLETWTRMDHRDNAVPLEVFMARLDRYVLRYLTSLLARFTEILLVEGLLGSFESLRKTVSTQVGSILR